MSTIEAISILEPLKSNDFLASLYNNLGIIYNELGDYDEAINYHKKALEIKKKFKNRNLESENNSINNIAVVYKDAKQYDMALKNFDQILENKNLKQDNPSLFALVLDNYAHTKFLLNEKEDVLNLYHEALKICDSVNDDYRAIQLSIHLSEYYNSINQQDSVKYYAYAAKNYAAKYHNDDYLKTLLHLSKIEE